MGAKHVAVAAALGIVLPHHAVAQSLAVSPTLIEIPPGKRGATVEVTNTATVPIDVQVRPYDWRQVEGKDVLTGSTTLLLSPALVTIPAGATQVLRVLAPAGPRTQEVQWRLLLDQLPGPRTKPGLQIKLRMSIPVFAYAAKTDSADVVWSVTGGKVQASNAGGRYARFGAVVLRGAGKPEIPLPLGTTPYLLPGATKSWPLPAAAGPGLAVAGQIGTRDFVAPLSVARDR